MNSTDNIILIYKESGVTSFNCLNYSKKIINNRVGHCGTLDKFAEGLIIACCGKYTKKVPLFTGLDKHYMAKIIFGAETDTLDPEGLVIATACIPDYRTIEKAVNFLKGTILQRPPRYSAIHINGKRSYKIARSGGVVEPMEREVTVFSSKIISWNSPFLLLDLHVSKGTYIRSYARDLGYLCSSRAYLTELKRTAVGPFLSDEAVLWNSEKLLKQVPPDNAEKILTRIENYLQNNSESSLENNSEQSGLQKSNT